jgi:DNA (cytosine-5)-methyltransferase 1
VKHVTRDDGVKCSNTVDGTTSPKFAPRRTLTNAMELTHKLLKNGCDHGTPSCMVCTHAAPHLEPLSAESGPLRIALPQELHDAMKDILASVERRAYAPGDTYEVQYHSEGRSISRTVRDGESATTSKISILPRGSDLASEFDRGWLRSKHWPEVSEQNGVVRVADLFCGLGGMTLGAWEACRSLGLRCNPIFAADTDKDATAVFASNFRGCMTTNLGVELFLDSDLGECESDSERQLKRAIQSVDLLLAGPPCQGHSDLNNFTRRNDPRNSLMLKVVRFAELFLPTNIMIENVQGARRDKNQVTQKAEEHLHRLGYDTESLLVDASDIGIAQKRRRFFLLASLKGRPDIDRIFGAHAGPKTDFDWACGDLRSKGSSVFDSPARVFEQNQDRMNYLIENDLYELPNSMRPDCHRLKDHGYHSVYGRMWADRPSPTITTGFGSPGQGRFTHPREPRTLTPHEAARLQFIPDFFQIEIEKRKKLQKLIGNAVPPKMAFALSLELLFLGMRGSN